MLEHYFQCPYCWENISFLLDTSAKQLNCIEDCEVCCNPIEITAIMSDGNLESFYFKNIEQ